jgi:hypothetical protein
MDTTTSSDIRSIVTDDEFGGFRITIPPTARAQARARIILRTWLLVVSVDLILLAARPISKNAGAILFLFLSLMVGAALAIEAAVGWLRRDVIIFDAKSVTVRKEFLFFRKERWFELKEIRNLRPALSLSRINISGRPSEVAFDMERGGTHQFGYGLSELEVARLVKTIRDRFPIRDDWKEVEPLPIAR